MTDVMFPAHVGYPALYPVPVKPVAYPAHASVLKPYISANPAPTAARPANPSALSTEAFPKSAEEDVLITFQDVDNRPHGLMTSYQTSNNNAPLTTSHLPTKEPLTPGEIFDIISEMKELAGTIRGRSFASSRFGYKDRSVNLKGEDAVIANDKGVVAEEGVVSDEGILNDRGAAFDAAVENYADASQDVEMMDVNANEQEEKQISDSAEQDKNSDDGLRDWDMMKDDEVQAMGTNLKQACIVM
jgi:hypothetical protein